MDILVSFAIIFLAGLIHASFHLSISTLTLLSGHTLSKSRSHLKLVKLATAMFLGTLVTSTVLFCSIAFIAQLLHNYKYLNLVWSGIIGLTIGTSASVFLFYYKRGTKKVKGTEMWIPRSMAKFLSQRASKTSHSAEAFSLGVTATFAEIFFMLAPLLAAGFAIINLNEALQFVAVILYVSIGNLPTFIITCLLSGGNPLPSIQIWREKNKRFLQFFASLSLLILSFVIYANIFGVNR